MKINRENGILLLYKLYRSVTKGVRISTGIAELGFLITTIQYVSYLIDSTNYKDVDFLKKDYIKALSVILGFSRFHRIAISSGEPDACFLFFFCFSLCFILLPIWAIVRYPLKHFDIFSSFKANDMEKISSQTEDSGQNIKISPNGQRVKTLRKFHLIFPFLFIPVCETLLSPFSSVYENKFPSQNIYRIIGLLATLWLFALLVLHCYFFNSECFDTANRLNRTMYRADVRKYMPYLIPIIINSISMFSGSLYVLLTIQALFFLSIYFDFKRLHYYYCPKTNAAFAKWTLFKFFFNIVLLSCSLISISKDTVLYFLITIPLVFRLAKNISNNNQLKLFENLFYVEEFREGRMAIDKVAKLSEERVLLTLLNVYAYFYYLDEEDYLRESLFDELIPDIKVIPLQLIGEFRLHHKKCFSKDCPLSKISASPHWVKY